MLDNRRLVTEAEAAEILGPSFYRTNVLEADRSGPVTRVRLTKAGKKSLASAKEALAEIEKGRPVY